MPLSSQQMAILVQRARAKAPPIPAAEPSPSRPRQAATTAPPAARQRRMPTPAPAPAVTPPPAKACRSRNHAGRTRRLPDRLGAQEGVLALPPPVLPSAPTPNAAGRVLHLLRQIWQHRGEHLGEHYWRVTLPDDRTTLVVTATRWRLITILPKNWQPTPACGLSPPAPQTGAVPPS